MPRARISDATEDIVLPKPRARRARVISEGEVAPAPRKRAAPRTRTVTAEVATPAPRKAPTPLRQQRRTQSRKTKSFVVVAFIGLLISGIGIGIGFMDGGAIDVVAVVNERNEKINKGEVRDEMGNTVTQTLQVQSDTRPNGGLPMGDEVAPAPAPIPQVSTTTQATSTEVVASSTEAETLEASTTLESL